MEFYLDDCADANDLIALLRQAGHGAHSPRGEGTRGVDDPIHLAHAAAKGYTLITKNPDDFILLHHEWQAKGQSHSGILLVYEDNVRDWPCQTSSACAILPSGPGMASFCSNPNAFWYQAIDVSASFTVRYGEIQDAPGGHGGRWDVGCVSFPLRIIGL